MRRSLCALMALLTMCVPAGAAPGVLGVRLVTSDSGPAPAALVDMVMPDGAASRAGLQPGDFVTAIDGHPVASGEAMQSAVRMRHAGQRIVLDVLRRTPNGFTSLKLAATLGSASPGMGTGQAAPVSQPRDAAQSAALAPFRGQVAQYVDPAEQAFAVKVPAGWRVGGRLVRYGPLSIAPFVQALAPDGSVFVQLGDWHLQDFADIPGWAEGRLYTPGTSIDFVRRLESADQYARSYAMTFQKMLGCANPAFAQSEEVAEPPGLARVPNSRAQTVVVHFNCTRDGQRYTGQVMTTVQAVRIYTMTGWNVIYLASVLSREDRAAEGIAAWNAMRGSFAFLPAWNAQESRIAGEAVRPAMEGLQQTMRQAENFDHDVLNGNVTVEDPTSGTRSDISMGAAPFYFADGTGRTYNSYDPTPRQGFHSLKQVPNAQ
jgi:hypothetical protein